MLLLNQAIKYPINTTKDPIPKDVANWQFAFCFGVISKLYSVWTVISKGNIGEKHIPNVNELK